MNRWMHARAWSKRAVFLGAAAMLSSTASAEILVTSQNTLHLGSGSSSVPGYLAGKNEFIRRLAIWPGSTLPRLTFLQEVMRTQDEDDIKPVGGEVIFGNLKGSTSYRERYGLVLVDVPADHVAILCHVDTASLVTAGTTLERAPDATLVSDTSSGRPQLIWFLNFHAIFGSGTTPRRAEAAEVGRIVATLRGATPAGCPATSQNVVVMGDWNLPGTDRAFTDLARNAGFTRLQVSPNALTSVSATGARVSAYDHFVWDDSLVQVTLATLPVQPFCNTTATVASGVVNPANLLTFRRHCSDHLGIVAQVRVR
ncbi:MAG TPA: hypothetical protein VFZ91_15040 [Allosphingosinicella sp.]